MSSYLNDQIMEFLSTGQRTYSDICERCGGSPSNVSAHLKEMMNRNEVTKSRVGKNVFYALRGQDLIPEEKSNRAKVLEVLSKVEYMQFNEILVKCPTLNRIEVTKAVANLVFDGKIFRHNKEKSRIMHYSTSNFVKGFLLVNQKRRNQVETYAPVGPFLREFLFDLPIVAK